MTLPEIRQRLDERERVGREAEWGKLRAALAICTCPPFMVRHSCHRAGCPVLSVQAERDKVEVPDGH